MKQRISIYILLSLCSLGSFAQAGHQKQITAEERLKIFVSHLSQKINLTKSQKDSITIVYTRFMDDIQKYNAVNNANLMTFLTKSRDEKIRNLLHDDLKYDQYLLFLEDVKKQREPQQAPSQPPQGQEQHNPMGNGLTSEQ